MCYAIIESFVVTSQPFLGTLSQNISFGDSCDGSNPGAAQQPAPQPSLWVPDSYDISISGPSWYDSSRFHSLAPTLRRLPRLDGRQWPSPRSDEEFSSLHPLGSGWRRNLLLYSSLCHHRQLFLYQFPIGWQRDFMSPHLSDKGFLRLPKAVSETRRVRGHLLHSSSVPLGLRGC